MPSDAPDLPGGPFASRTHVLTLGYGPENDVWPITLLEAALSFARVADAASANLGVVNSASSDGLTILLLLGQSIELALKAFLQPRGYDQEKLRQKIGHNLPKALNAAIEVGFPHRHPSDKKLLQLLDATYNGRRKLQYRVVSAINVPLLRPVRELAQVYLIEVHKAATCSIADLEKVPGLAIAADADYGPTSLMQFRVGAENLHDLRQLKE